jgi:hypothetical protein
MIMDLPIQPPAALDVLAAARRGGPPSAVAQGSSSPAAPARPAVSDLPSGSPLEVAATRAAGALYAGREVEVSSFHDEATGRMVHRIADPRSGRVLLQSPSEELLRFYASSRPDDASPLVAIDA